MQPQSWGSGNGQVTKASKPARLAYLGSSRPTRGPIWKRKKDGACITSYDGFLGLYMHMCAHTYTYMHRNKQEGLGVMEQKVEVGRLLP